MSEIIIHPLSSTGLWKNLVKWVGNKAFANSEANIVRKEDGEAEMEEIV